MGLNPFVCKNCDLSFGLCTILNILFVFFASPQDFHLGEIRGSFGHRVWTMTNKVLLRFPNCDSRGLGKLLQVGVKIPIHFNGLTNHFIPDLFKCVR